MAHLARVYDEGMPLPILPTRYVEENLWRAIRYGMDGKLVDWAMREEVTATDAIRHLVELCGAARRRASVSRRTWATWSACCARATAHSSR